MLTTRGKMALKTLSIAFLTTISLEYLLGTFVNNWRQSVSKRFYPNEPGDTSIWDLIIP
jgi:hypothetical protein